MNELERALSERIRQDEANFSRSSAHADTLWDHSLRVGKLAASVGTKEGLDPELCYLAGLFHDAGKFTDGRYHEGDLPEEVQSVRVLRELGTAHGMSEDYVEQISNAILQLYCDTEATTLLANVLFDADNLDKLGPMGVANFFHKAGLRGRGISHKLLRSLTIELTYAHAATTALATATGRALAKKRAAQSVAFYTLLLDTLREDGLADFELQELVHDGLKLVIVAPRACECGSNLERSTWDSQGVKCTKINLKHECPACGATNKLVFCRPRL